MTTYSAADLQLRQIHESSFGNASIHEANLTPGGATSGDVYRVLRIPGGTRVDRLTVINDALDSNGSKTLACKIGFTPVNSTDGPTADDDYWVATGSTILQTAALTDSKSHPITFSYDVWVDITLTANAATYASGKISVVALTHGIGR